MYNPFKAFTNWLLDRQPLPEGEDFRLIAFDDMFEKKTPWQTRLYYTVYRFFRWNWIFHPTQWYYNTKYFIQRGRRGWANCDTWSLDYYLNTWMPEALEYLKKHTHSVPMMVFTDEESKAMEAPYEKNKEVYDGAVDAASARWGAIMDKMIEGFKAARRMDEGLYEEELGEYPLHRPANMSKEEFVAQRGERCKRIKGLLERDEAIRVEGMTLFVKYYNDLWD